MNKKQPQPNFLNDLNISQDAENKLSVILDRTVKGDKTILRTPFLKDESQESILELFDKWFDSHSKDLSQELKELEMLNRSKFGPRSIQKNWEERKKSVYDYFRSSDISHSLDKVKPSQQGRLRPVSYANAIQLLKNNTSSGIPFMKKKGLVKDETLSNINNLLQREDPCVMFTRTQEGGFPQRS